MTMDWNQRYSYHFPTPIRFGKGVIEELADHLHSMGLKSPLIVTDPTLPNLDFFKKIISSLKKEGHTPTVFNEIDKNPVKKNVEEGATFYHSSKADSVVGIGGGASMDVARAIALAAHHERDLFDFDDALGGDKFVTEKIPYFITVPTTSGTGSEVGRSAVISEDETHIKRILFSPRLMPSQVFADPELTLKLPPSITAATGMDALSHNIEAYFSKGFSPLCDGIALEGIRLVAQSLEGATNNPNLENKSKMMMAALMGATAFQKGLGVVHSLAHPLSTVYDIHHGLANAVMLPFGVEFNKEICADKISYLSKILNLPDGTDSVANWIMKLNQKIKMPSSLGSLGVKNEGIEKLSALALADVCHLCNPREVSLQNFKDIYTKALS
jgi:alcohol dehydrogenase class IV